MKRTPGMKRTSRGRRPGSAARAALLLMIAALLLGGCTSNPYYIGAVCPDAAGGSATSGPCSGTAGSAGLSFALDLDQTGTSHLPDTLQLASGALRATLTFHGETATASDWPSVQGPHLGAGVGAALVQLEAPFTDGTQAISASADAPAYGAATTGIGAIDGDDFALELVLRAAQGRTVLDKRAAATGWSVTTTPGGALLLTLDDGRNSFQIEGEPLVDRAWYHCLFWVSRAAGGRVDCNGRAGARTDLSSLGSLASSAQLSVAGGSPAGLARIQLGYFALFRSPRGGLGDSATWQDCSRRRFASLTGVSPRLALGSALPAPGLRDSVAFLDLQALAGAPRRLFLVGADWPRVACRSDVLGAHDCGYLSEPQRARLVDPAPRVWTASALSVSASQADFADGEQRMDALVASTALAPHTLSWTGTYGVARQVLSFFARAGAGKLVAANVSNRGRAIFDIEAGTVVAAAADVSASVEPWGNGLFRCAYLFELDPGALTYQLELLGDPSGRPFAGDGKSAWLHVVGLQLDVGQAYAGSLLAALDQAPDQLTFVGNDGNLPSSSSVSQTLRVLLPAGPRLTDQAVLNLNRAGQFDNQVGLYVTGNTGQLSYSGLKDGITHWTFIHPASFLDGARHTIAASWTPTGATLSVDGVSSQADALPTNEPPFSLDRIDVGFSPHSSGSLEGLVAGIELGAP